MNVGSIDKIRIIKYLLMYSNQLWIHQMVKLAPKEYLINIQTLQSTLRNLVFMSVYLLLISQLLLSSASK